MSEHEPIDLNELASKEIVWFPESKKPTPNLYVLCSDGTGLDWQAKWSGTYWEIARQARLNGPYWEIAHLRSRIPVRWAYM